MLQYIISIGIFYRNEQNQVCFPSRVSPKNAEFTIISFVLYRNSHLVVTLLNKWNTNYKWHLYDHNHSFLAARNIFFREEPAFLQMAWKKMKLAEHTIIPVRPSVH